MSRRDRNSDSLARRKRPVLAWRVCFLAEEALVSAAALLFLRLSAKVSERSSLSAGVSEQSSLAFNPVCQPGITREEQRIYFLWWGVFVRHVLIQRNNLLFSFLWNWPSYPEVLRLHPPSNIHPCVPGTWAFAAVVGMP